MKSIPQTPKKLLSNWVGKPFQAILLIIFLIWTPLLIAETLDVQESCHPMIDWDHPVSEKCHQNEVVLPPTPKNSKEKALDAVHKVFDELGKLSEETKLKVSDRLSKILESSSKIVNKFRGENPSPPPVVPSSPEPNLIEKIKNLFNISPK